MTANRTYAALENGRMVPRQDTRGTVVSVFDKAVNIRLRSGLLASLVRSSRAMTPLSIHCPDLFGSGSLPPLAAGRPVALNSRAVTCDNVRVDLNGAVIFTGVWEPACCLSPDRVRLDLFEQALARFRGRGGLVGVMQKDAPGGDLFLTRGRQIVDGIMAADPTTLNGNIAKHLVEQLARFIGLGPGFTPSGDDLVCGFLLGQEMTGRCLVNANGKQALENAAEFTNDGGKTLVRMALKGRFPRYLLRSARCLARAGTPAEMNACIEPASGVGHTSGLDALTGLLLFFKAVDQDRLRTSL